MRWDHEHNFVEVYPKYVTWLECYDDDGTKYWVKARIFHCTNSIVPCTKFAEGEGKTYKHPWLEAA